MLQVFTTSRRNSGSTSTSVRTRYVDPHLLGPWGRRWIRNDTLYPHYTNLENETMNGLASTACPCEEDLDRCNAHFVSMREEARRFIQPRVKELFILKAQNLGLTSCETNQLITSLGEIKPAINALNKTGPEKAMEIYHDIRYCISKSDVLTIERDFMEASKIEYRESVGGRIYCKTPTFRQAVNDTKLQQQKLFHCDELGPNGNMTVKRRATSKTEASSVGLGRFAGQFVEAAHARPSTSKKSRTSTHDFMAVDGEASGADTEASKILDRVRDGLSTNAEAIQVCYRESDFRATPPSILC
jgi:hypothetical protein